MSCFLEILRCIIGFVKDDDRRDYRTHSSDTSREYSLYEPISQSSSSSSSYDTQARTNRDYLNSGSVNSISYGSVKNPPTVTESPLRVPPTPPTPLKVTQKPIILQPLPSPPSVHQKKPVALAVNEKSTITAVQQTINKPVISSSGSSQSVSNPFLSSSGPLSSASKGNEGIRIILQPLPSPPSVHQKKPVALAVNEKSTITAKLETIKSSPAKGNEGIRTQNNLAQAPPAAFSKNSSDAFLFSNNPVTCSSGLPQSSSGPLSSASKATPVSLKAATSSRGPHPSASEPTLSQNPSPVQKGSTSVAVEEDIKYPISFRSPNSELGPSPSPSNSHTFQRGKTPTFTLPPLPQSLPPATKSPQSSPKLPPFSCEPCSSASTGTPSPTPCNSDKTNPAKKTKLVWVQKDTTPISSTAKVIKNLITPPQSFPRPLPSDSDSSPSSSNVSPSLNGTSPFSSMPDSTPFGPPDPPKRNTYFVEGATLRYEIPEDIKNLIKRDIVPYVLKEPVTPRTYKDYFATLLYAEDFYIEKWNKFCLENVALELEKVLIRKKSNKKKYLNNGDKYEEKLLVVFEINLIPERRPFLLSRDFVFLRPAGKEVEPFKGILYRVCKKKRVLAEFGDRVVKRDIVSAEFGDDFHLQHSPDNEYDINFSFNRVCLKRSHQAIAAATNLLFQNFLFPDQISRTRNFALPFIPSRQNLDQDQISAVQQILRLRGSPPYLIDGPLSFKDDELSRTGLVIREAVLQIYKNSPCCRILVSAPTNKTCDKLVESLDDEIPDLDIFRANAAFREIDSVPDDILPLCQYEGECFTCPSLKELQSFKVVFSTFMSSFRLHNEGLPAGHFSHVFLVDASSAMEPETLVVLTNLVDENTNVVVTGASWNSPGWVRSDIGRWNGLKKSYFERLLESEPYCGKDSMFVKHLYGSQESMFCYTSLGTRF